MDDKAMKWVQSCFGNLRKFQLTPSSNGKLNYENSRSTRSHQRSVVGDAGLDDEHKVAGCWSVGHEVGENHVGRYQFSHFDCTSHAYILLQRFVCFITTALHYYQRFFAPVSVFMSDVSPFYAVHSAALLLFLLFFSLLFSDLPSFLLLIFLLIFIQVPLRSFWFAVIFPHGSTPNLLSSLTSNRREGKTFLELDRKRNLHGSKFKRNVWWRTFSLSSHKIEIKSFQFSYAMFISTHK